MIISKTNWSERELKNFSQELNKTIELTSRNPELFQTSRYKYGVRRAVVAEYNTVYYRINDDVIEILSIFSNRQNPERLKI